nr:hypothetical protein HmN_000734900 [Hymenolepis microstoma]
MKCNSVLEKGLSIEIHFSGYETAATGAKKWIIDDKVGEKTMLVSKSNTYSIHQTKPGFTLLKLPHIWLDIRGTAHHEMQRTVANMLQPKFTVNKL